MVSISAKQAAAILAFLTVTVQGHIVMTQPTPFEYANPPSKQAPLEATGADFPCKFPAGFTPKDQAPGKIVAGTNTMLLEGGATHGGGSCQISLTTDVLPTKNSKWEVIKSIEGGCPSDAPGNLSGDAQGKLPPIEYTIPADMAAGKYTLAWTWFNKIGNREMYMNCAPVELGGAAAKREIVKFNKKRQSARPNIFMANIGNGCSTTESTDVTFPDPGQDLVKGGAAVPGAPVGSCGAAGAQPAGPAAAPAASTTASAPAASSSAAASNVAAAPAASSSAATAPIVAAEGAAPASGAACSPEGMFSCSADGSSFTRCASGVMSAPITMSAGTKCVPGQDPTTLKMSVVKRAVRFGAEHFARSSEAGY